MPGLTETIDHLIEPIDSGTLITQRTAFTGPLADAARMLGEMVRKTFEATTAHFGRLAERRASHKSAWVKQLSAPCPAWCQIRITSGTPPANSSDIQQIITELGCTCLVGQSTRGPELYLHLARVLGFETPEGVLQELGVSSPSD